jgi:predicted metal-binding protein
MHDLHRFEGVARRLGAEDAKIIDAASVKTAPWVRLKCQFGCGGYGQGYCCPPHSPTPQEMSQVIACYTKALLFHSTELGKPASMAYDLEREIFLAGFYKALGLGSGPCMLCRKCPSNGCSHPDKARPSMEACGIDVYATVRANGLPIEVVQDENCSANYYGLILID